MIKLTNKSKDTLISIEWNKWNRLVILDKQTNNSTAKWQTDIKLILKNVIFDAASLIINEENFQNKNSFLKEVKKSAALKGATLTAALFQASTSRSTAALFEKCSC